MRTWRWLHEMVDGQKDWKVAEAWLCQHRAALPAAEESARRLFSLGWNTGLKSLPGARTLPFARMISDRMISDDLLDMMMSMLRKRVVAQHNLASKVRVVLLSATEAEDYIGSKKGYLQNLEKRLKEENMLELWFLALWEEQDHWLPFKCRFNKRFKCIGDILTCGRQNDGINCGIIAVSTVAHNTIGDDLWTSSRKVQDRLDWFNTLCDEHERSTAGPAAQSAIEKVPVVYQPPRLPLSLARVLNSPTRAPSPPAASATHNRAAVTLHQLLNPITVSASAAATIPESLSRLLNPTPDPAPSGSNTGEPTEELQREPVVGDDYEGPMDESWLQMEVDVDAGMEVDVDNSEPNMMDIEITPEVSYLGTSGNHRICSIFTQAKGSSKRKLKLTDEEMIKSSKKARVPGPRAQGIIVIEQPDQCAVQCWELEEPGHSDDYIHKNDKKIDEFAEITDSMNIHVMKDAFNTSSMRARLYKNSFFARAKEVQRGPSAGERVLSRAKECWPAEVPVRDQYGRAVPGAHPKWQPFKTD
ncbi:hypothetical protein DFH09DRAFT_1089851 [Mycena vulgaris]|nr:hypothetical protein DFH09DRAFT_1089851 [Mycena vulgaris]